MTQFSSDLSLSSVNLNIFNLSRYLQQNTWPERSAECRAACRASTCPCLNCPAIGIETRGRHSFMGILSCGRVLILHLLSGTKADCCIEVCFSNAILNFITASQGSQFSSLSILVIDHDTFFPSYITTYKRAHGHQVFNINTSCAIFFWNTHHSWTIQRLICRYLSCTIGCSVVTTAQRASYAVSSLHDGKKATK